MRVIKLSFINTDQYEIVINIQSICASSNLPTCSLSKSMMSIPVAADFGPKFWIQLDLFINMLDSLEIHWIIQELRESFTDACTGPNVSILGYLY